MLYLSWGFEENSPWARIGVAERARRQAGARQVRSNFSNAQIRLFGARYIAGERFQILRMAWLDEGFLRRQSSVTVHCRITAIVALSATLFLRRALKSLDE